MAEATIACDGVPPDSWTAPEEESAAGGRLESGAVATLLVAAVVFINEASFRIPPTEESSLDWQVLLRLAVCGACGIYGLAHLRVAVQALERFPANLIVAFGTWSLVSVPFAVDIPYAVASCACLWCVILFAPAALQHLGLRRVLIVVLASLAAFAVGSWIMYFAVPSVGRTEFLNPDGEVVGRLGGLNHANGLGRQMSVMTMMVLLLGSQKMVRWRALLPWLVLALVTLAFTNSRTPMVATAAVAGFLFLRKVGFDVIMRKGWAMLALMGALAAVMVVGSDVTLLAPFPVPAKWRNSIRSLAAPTCGTMPSTRFVRDR